LRKLADKSGDILATKTTSKFGGRYSRILCELTVLLAMSAGASPRKVSPQIEAAKNDSERQVTKKSIVTLCTMLQALRHNPQRLT